MKTTFKRPSPAVALVVAVVAVVAAGLCASMDAAPRVAGNPASEARVAGIATASAQDKQEKTEKKDKNVPTSPARIVEAPAATADAMKALDGSAVMRVDADPAKALAYVYRRGRFQGSVRTYTVFCDEVELADMENGRYFIIKVDPGRHVLRSEDGRKIEVDLAAAATYFFEVSLKSGDGDYSSKWSMWGHVEAVEPSKAIEQLVKLKPAKKDRVKSADLVVGTYEK